VSVRRIQNPWLSDVLTTANAVATVSAATSFVVPAGVGAYCEMCVTARNTATGASSTAKVGRTFQNVGGVLTLTGALIAIVGAAGAGVGDVTMTAILANFTQSGVTFQPQVTGIAVTNIEWLLDVRYWLN
jgi:hypothetical protein